MTWFAQPSGLPRLRHQPAHDRSCVEPLEQRTLMSAAAPVTTVLQASADFVRTLENGWLINVEFDTATAPGFGTNVKLEITDEQDNRVLRAYGDSVQSTLVMSPNLSSAHVDAIVPMVEDGGERTFYLNVELDFQRVGPLDGQSVDPGYVGRLVDAGREAVASGTVVIDPYVAEQLPADVPAKLLSPEDLSYSGSIFQFRTVLPFGEQTSSILAAGTTLASDLFSQTPVLN